MPCHIFWSCQQVRFSCKRGDPSGVIAESIDICYYTFKETPPPQKKYVLFLDLNPLQPERQMGKVKLGFLLLKFLIHLYTLLEQ